MAENRIIKYSVCILVLLFIIVIFLLIKQNYNLSVILGHETEPNIGEKAYIFEAKTSKGKKVNLKDKKTILVFINMECKTCTKSIKLLQDVYPKIKISNVDLYIISNDESSDIIREMKENDHKLPVIFDKEKNLFWKYKVRQVPLIIFIINGATKVLG